MKLILFELKKIIRTKVFPIILLLTVLVIGGLFMSNVMQQELIAIKKVEFFSENALYVFSLNQGDKKMLEKGPDTETEARLEVGNALYAELKLLIQHIETNKWEEELQTEIDVYLLAMHYEEIKGGFLISERDMEKTIKLNEELLSRELPKEDHELSIQTSIFMKKVISLFLNTVGFLIIILVLATMITKEFEENNMQMVFALPIARSKFIAVKFISLFIAGFVWLATVFAVSYALPTFFGKNIGNIFNYPLFTEAETFLSSGAYVKEAIHYSISFLGFSMAVALFFGFLLRNSIVNSLVIFLLFLGGFIVSNNGFNLIGNPFTYQNIDHAILMNSTFYPVGLIVLIGAMLLVYLFSLSINRKRGI